VRAIADLAGVAYHTSFGRIYKWPIFALFRHRRFFVFRYCDPSWGGISVRKIFSAVALVLAIATATTSLIRCTSARPVPRGRRLRELNFLTKLLKVRKIGLFD